MGHSLKLLHLFGKTYKRKNLHLHAAGPGCLALAAPGKADSTGRLGQGERHLRTVGSAVGYSEGWEVLSHTLGSMMIDTVGGWWGQTPGVVDPRCSLPWRWR